MNAAERLVAEAVAIATLGAEVLDADDIGTHAVEYALSNWKVFPLRGKVPAIPNPHPKGSIERQTCKGQCGKQGHGVLDATTDLPTVIAWWSGKYGGCNIGCRVPDNAFVFDVDPQSGGDVSLAALLNEYGPLPDTLGTVSGRGTGGTHRFYRRPPGELSSKRLGRGIDIKTSSGYMVAPPSIHPDSGMPYSRIDGLVASPPPWLVALLRPEPIQRTHRAYLRRVPSLTSGPSIADRYSSTASWVEILEPHGWRCLDADPDADGARWRHPAASSQSSATVQNGCLFVWSPNTQFDITETGNPRGYTRFRAYAVLNHGGDLSAAARSLRQKDSAAA